MGLRAVCDCGCGKSTDDLSGLKAHGFIHKVYYLPECSAPIEEFLKARNQLHTQIAQEFTKKLETLKQTFHTVNPNAKLPDDA